MDCCLWGEGGCCLWGEGGHCFRREEPFPAPIPPSVPHSLPPSLPTPTQTKCVQLLSTLIALMLAPGSPHSLCKAVVNALGNVAACSAQLAGAVVEQQALEPLTRLVRKEGGELGRGRRRVWSPPLGL